MRSICFVDGFGRFIVTVRVQQFLASKVKLVISNLY